MWELKPEYRHYKEDKANEPTATAGKSGADSDDSMD